ncbi:DUF5719 family protein [Streptomyces zagrosensis]|uniref:Secreted protein n=1 Tax=Streptomyces zagrosensis TaxID=1042984 RepID=A0A7W9QHJ2_9ACTN|nr:DUF5719 family protein [Streptomyces zagrosensis]MBB5939082.1 hypothetical protein [Streptomyces zagrosensis]
MNRTTLSLIAATTALAALTGVASMTSDADSKTDTGADGAHTATASRLPVERSSLVCPAPTSSELGETTYTAYTPKGKTPGTANKGAAELLPAHTAAGTGDGNGSNGSKDGSKGDKGSNGDSKDGDASGTENGKASDSPGRQDVLTGDPVLPLKAPGAPVTVTTSRSDAPALIGISDGALAPGWTVQQTTTVSAGDGRGLLGTSCVAPGTDFWFPGASTAGDRQDYVHLTNPDSSQAVVDLELYGEDGRIDAPSGESINIPPHSTKPVLLSTLVNKPTINLTLHAAVRSGRIGASVQVADTNIGSDWLPAASGAATSAVLPGIPKDATSVRLIAYATGSDDAEMKIRLSGPTGAITPAGHETLNVKSRMTSAVDLGDITKGEPGSLVLTPQGKNTGPFVAALRVTRGKGDRQETAFIPATAAIEDRGTAADNRSKGSTLSLTAPEAAATVRVTSSAGSEDGAPASRQITVKAGTTVAVDPPRPSAAKGPYAVTVERLDGGPVHASRMLELPSEGVPMFTIQGLPDDRGLVTVPRARQDLSLLND